MDFKEQRDSLREQVRAQIRYIAELHAAANRLDDGAGKQVLLNKAQENEEHLASLELKLSATEDALFRRSS